MTLESLPQPARNAETVVKVTGAICASLPGLATLKELMQITLELKIEKYQKKLISLVSERGIEVLSEEQSQFYLPAAYRFFEQVRIGEYHHNLHVLGRLIAGELDSAAVADAGKIGRAARKLEMLSFEQLAFLGMCKRGFELTHISKRESATPGCLEPLIMVDAFGEQGRDYTYMQAQEHLHELSTRGLLTTGSNPKTIGGHYYYRNAVFEEIIAAAETVVQAGSEE
nr:hypothetical protein [uncultured Shinella sp.]